MKQSFALPVLSTLPFIEFVRDSRLNVWGRSRDTAQISQKNQIHPALLRGAVNLWTVGCADPRLTGQQRSPYGQAGKRMRFPRLAHRSAAATASRGPQKTGLI